MREFRIEGTDFIRDGKPHKIMSGTIHYFRVPREYWYDRLLKLKECGFNTVETYIAWNLHEKKEGVFDFSGDLDVEHYVTLAKQLGLDVIIRPGPYICAEWDMGGLPAWLLSYKNIKLRCSDPLYLSKVKAYFDVLLPKFEKHLYKNGGGIIMMQIENEYGAYGDDKEYLAFIRDLYIDHRLDCPYFTSDGPRAADITAGSLDGNMTVVNFGRNTADAIDTVRRLRPDQPAMSGEFWSGWYDSYGVAHHVKTAERLKPDFEAFFEKDASFNCYMFHGGTNFGFMGGANLDAAYEPPFEVDTTSYDYSCPLSEAGDRTDIYYMMRDVIKKYTDVPVLTAKESEKASYGEITPTASVLLTDSLDRISKPVRTLEPAFMEDLGQNHGYIFYRSELDGIGEDKQIFINTVHDRAQIFIDGKKVGTYGRMTPPERQRAVWQSVYGKKSKVDVLCENRGRVNFGAFLHDKKGIDSFRLGLRYHYNWDCYTLPMDNLEKLVFGDVIEKTDKPVFHRFTIVIDDEPKDTFVRTVGLSRGFITVNGFNLGRYNNEEPPQKHLYLPGVKLHRGENEITVFDSEGSCRPSLVFEDKPDFGVPLIM